MNNSTGELMAMKEIAIQPGETKAIRNVAEELKIFEGISHKNLVKVYGVEIHRVSVEIVHNHEMYLRILCIASLMNNVTCYPITRRSYLFLWNCVQRGR